MEFYEEFNSDWNTLLTTGETTPRLKDHLIHESPKEIHLMFVEFLSNHSTMTKDQLILFLPTSLDLIERLSNVSHLIVMDEVSTIDMIVQNLDYDDQESIYEFLKLHSSSCPTQDYYILLALTSQRFPQDIALQITPPSETFSSLPACYRLAYARAAAHVPDSFRQFNLSSLSISLIESMRPFFIIDGIQLAIFLCSESTSFSDPCRVFVDIVTVGPRLPTINDARHAWMAALQILSSMSISTRYETLRSALEIDTLPETSRAALTHQVMSEANNPAATIFRSPLVTEMLPLILRPEMIKYPTQNVEGLMTALNFLRYMLLIDRNFNCYKIYQSNEGRKYVEKMLKKLNKALNEEKTKFANRNSVLENMKKMEIAKNMTDADVDKTIKESELAIKRIEHVVKLIQNLTGD